MLYSSKMFRVYLLCCFLMPLVFNNAGWAQEKALEGATIKAIEVTGNRRIETSTILTKIKTREGDIFSAGALREDINSLYMTDYFEDIRAETEPFEDAIKLLFHVRERPILQDVIFDGNDKVSIEKLKEKATLLTGTPLSQKQVTENVVRLKALYQDEGYYDAAIIPVIKRLSDDKATVTFFIKEGKKIKIKVVRIPGTEKISEGSIRKALKTKRYMMFVSWLTGSGVYKEIEAQNDTDRIRDYYLDRGYVQVQVSDPEIEIVEDGRWMSINFTVTEGEQFTVGGMDFIGNDIFTGEEIQERIKMREGMTFNRSMLREDIALIIDMYGEEGYAFANVVPDLRPDEASRRVDIIFMIEKGEKIKVRRINIRGNEKTRDKVIRREMRLSELDYLDTSALKRSFQRINNLNYFENVEIVPEIVSKDMVDLNLKIKEKPTGAFSMGGGYSSVYGFVGMVDLTEGNLFGRGQLLRFKGEFGELRTSYNVTFREPWLMDSPTSGTINLFNTISSFDTSGYEVISRGGNLGLGRAFKEYWSSGLSYGIQNITVKGNVPRRLNAEESTTGSISSYITRDTRDNYWDTRSGNKNNLSVEYADTFLAGNNIFIKYIVDTAWYFPAPLDTAFMLHGKYGEGRGLRGKNLPVNEKFYVGGIYTVRGFRYGRATTPSTVEGDPVRGELLGADKELIFNVEYIIPLVKEARIKGVIFYDAGSGFGRNDDITLSDLRTSVGGGIRWLSPIGPLRLEWGYNLEPRPGEDIQLWEFSIGSLF